MNRDWYDNQLKEQQRHPPVGQRPRQRQWPTRVFVLFISVAFGLAFAKGFGLWPFESSEPRVAYAPRAEAPNPMAGCFVAKQAVTARLKAPATASFAECWRNGELVCLNVDSQNGFGVLIRSTWLVRFGGAASDRITEVVNVPTMRCLQ